MMSAGFAHVIVGVALLTAWLTGLALLLLLRKLLEPLYSAVMEWLPAVIADVEQVAWPPAPRETPVQIAVPSALKVTEPSPVSGLPVPAPVPVTVAVKVTESPKVEGFDPAVL